MGGNFVGLFTSSCKPLEYGPGRRREEGNPGLFGLGEARRKEALDRRARNQFPFAIDRFGQGINHCFGNIGKKSEASGHVAVESAIPYRHLGFVAGAENHRTELIRQSHEEISANSCLQIFFRHIFRAAAERFG